MIYRIINELPWIMMPFGYKWGDLRMIFTSDEAMSENYWWITSWVTKNSLFMASYISFYSFHALTGTNTEKSIKTQIDRHIIFVYGESVNCAIVMSRKQILWRHFDRFSPECF